MIFVLHCTARMNALFDRRSRSSSRAWCSTHAAALGLPQQRPLRSAQSHRHGPTPAFPAVAAPRKRFCIAGGRPRSGFRKNGSPCYAQVATHSTVRRQLKEVVKARAKPAARGGKRAVQRPTPKPRATPKASRAKPQKAVPKPHKPPPGHSKPPKSPPPKNTGSTKHVVSKPTRGSRKGGVPVKPPTRPPVRTPPKESAHQAA